MGADIAAEGGCLFHGSADFAIGELQAVERIVGGRDAAGHHDLDMVGALAHLLARGFADFIDAVGDRRFELQAVAADAFAAAIGAIQTNSFVRRVSWIFDCAMVVLAAALSGALRRFSRIDLIIGAIAFTAAYCLVALGMISRFSIWIPAWLPLGATWISVLFAILLPKRKDSARTVSIAAPPPAP